MASELAGHKRHSTAWWAHHEQEAWRPRGWLHARPHKLPLILNEFALPQPPEQHTKQDGVSKAIKQTANDWLARNRSLALRQTPFWAQSFTGILLGLAGLALIGGSLYRIDEVVTVNGQLEAQGGTTQVKSPVGGLVADVLVKDGEAVRKGQPLVRFDTRAAQAEQVNLLRSIQLEEQDLQARRDALASQLRSLNSRRQVLRQKLATARMMTTELKRLVDQGGYQRLTYLDQVDKRYELEKQLADVDQQEQQAKLQATDAELESSKRLSQLRANLKNTEVQIAYQNLLAPVAGIVFDSKAAVKGVIPAGEPILKLVPQQGLTAKVFVPNKDIGNIKQGQKAKVRVDAFPYQRYGELNGTVSRVAADALPPDPSMNFYRYPVTVTLDRSTLSFRGATIPLQSGMAITTNLKLRDKRVISLLSDMLVEQVDPIRSLRQQ